MSDFEQQLLTVWEQGNRQHRLDQSLTMLLHFTPNADRNSLVTLSVGQRDYRLLILREYLFGTLLQCDCDCPECQEKMEVSFNLAELKEKFDPGTERDVMFSHQGFQLKFRQPNSADLARIVGNSDSVRAGRVLLERCFVSAEANNQSIVFGDIPNNVLAFSEQQIQNADPFNEILLDINCAECGAPSQTLFDIGQYLWSEITTFARQLLQQIHMLASAYGWSEQQVLELSPLRRKIYLEMADA